MEPHDLTSDALQFGIAILLGALVGIEREKHREERKAKTEQAAGLRSLHSPGHVRRLRGLAVPDVGLQLGPGRRCADRRRSSWRVVW